MYIILEYITENFDSLHIVREGGELILFGSEHSAEQYAEKNCSWNYKIVEL